MSEDDGGPVEVEVEIADGRTVIEVTGDRDAVVVVRSAAGEQIYLPPEDFERPPESRSQRDSPYQRTTGTGAGDAETPDSPYQSADAEESSDSPYQSPAEAPSDSPYQSPDAETPDSPYQSAAEAPSDSPYQPTVDPATTTGLEPTADGFRIVHPEPVTDFRLLR
jgi:hypothetical protein